jgi:hypothetical protein
MHAKATTQQPTDTVNPQCTNSHALRSICETGAWGDPACLVGQSPWSVWAGHPQMVSRPTGFTVHSSCELSCGVGSACGRAVAPAPAVTRGLWVPRTAVRGRTGVGMGHQLWGTVVHLVGSWTGLDPTFGLLCAELLYGDRDGVFIFEKQAKITTKTADGVVSELIRVPMRCCPAPSTASCTQLTRHFNGLLRLVCTICCRSLGSPANSRTQRWSRRCRHHSRPTSMP